MIAMVIDPPAIIYPSREPPRRSPLNVDRLRISRGTPTNSTPLGDAVASRVRGIGAGRGLCFRRSFFACHSPLICRKSAADNDVIRAVVAGRN